MEEPDDCLGCKLISTFGCFGLSGYIAYHSRFYSHKQRPIGFFVSAVFAVGGIVSLFDLHPSAKRKSVHSSPTASLHTQIENNENN